MKQSNFLSAPPPAQFRVETNIPTLVRGKTNLADHPGQSQAR